MIDGLGLLKMAFPAAIKVGSIAFQKVARLRKIDDVLKGIEQDSNAKKAIDDFERVRGTWRGEFDVTVNTFLRAFEKSALLQAVYNDSLLSIRAPGVRASFVQLFVTETGQCSENGDALYEQIHKSFEITARYITKDPILAEIVQASHGAIAAGIQRIDESVESICSAIRSRPTSEVLKDIVPKLLRSAVSEFRVIRVETSQGRKDVDIGKIYIPPRLEPRNVEQIRSSIKVFVDTIAKEHPDQRLDSFSHRSRRENLENSLSSVFISDIMELARVVVLGNPGGGKSTLLQSVCHTVASESLKFVSDGGDASSALIPIRVVLRDYERARLQNSQLGLFEYIAGDLLHSTYVERPVIARLLETMLGNGRVLLAFDGLDEILKTSLRRQFVDLVIKFTNQYPLCPVIVTSREVGYDKAPLPAAEFEEFVLGEFLDKDVETYAEKFARHVARKRAEESRKSAKKFISQTAQNASDLRKNPLMLGLMMWIFSIRDDVPSNRPDIYQECASLMFERWDGDRDIIIAIPNTFDRLQIFAYLASKIFDDEDCAGGVSQNWIESTSRAYLTEVLESRPKAHEAAKSLVGFIVERSWVMTEKGEGVFSFTHQTFLEYFFAKYISDEYDTVAELFSRLLPHIRQEEWDVVSRLALQIKTHRNTRKEDQSINFLVEAMSADNINIEDRRSIVAFSVRCLEFLIGTEPGIRRLLDTIMDAACKLVSEKDSQILDAMPLILSGAKERRDFIFGVVLEHFKSSFQSGGDASRNFISACVDGLVGSFGGNGITHECKALPHSLARQLRLELTPFLEPEIDTNIEAARKHFEWTGVVRPSALKKYGLDLLHYARPQSTVQVDGLSALVLAASGRYAHFFSTPGLAKARAEQSLSLIGDFARKSGIQSLSVFPPISHLSNPPIGVWAEILRGVKADVNVRLGALVCYFVESDNSGTYLHPQSDENRQMVDISQSFKGSFARARDEAAVEIATHVLERLRANSERDAQLEMA